LFSNLNIVNKYLISHILSVYIMNTLFTKWPSTKHYWWIWTDDLLLVRQQMMIAVLLTAINVNDVQW